MAAPQENGDKLVPLNIMVPERVKGWLQTEAYQQSSPGNKVSVGEVSRELLEEKYQERMLSKRS